MKKPDEGHVVQDFYDGHTHVIICDDYCRDKTDEEVDEILKRIAKKALEHYAAAAKHA